MPENKAGATEQKCNSGFTSGFTMTANWILDEVAINESEAVLKVVLYINRNTIGRTERDGSRVEALQASYKWLAERTNLSERAVGQAVRIAVEKGYLIKVKPGRAASANIAGEGGWYAINKNWAADNSVSYVNSEETEARQILPVEPEKLEAVQILPEIATQILPVDKAKAVQILPPCNNKVSNSNKPIEIKAVRQQRQSSLALASNRSEAENPNKRKGSDALGRLITDLTREFGDNPALSLPNISRVLNLWHKSGLTESKFIELIYQARQKTQSSATIQHRRLAANGSQSDLPNRMPYFFAVLEGLLSPERDVAQQVLNSPRRHGDTENLKIKPTSVEVGGFTGDLGAVVVDEVENYEPKAPTVAENSIWHDVLPQLGNLTKAKQEILLQAELVRANEGNCAWFQLKFAREWHKTLFSQWELDRLELALEQVLGERIGGLRVAS